MCTDISGFVSESPDSLISISLKCGYLFFNSWYLRFANSRRALFSILLISFLKLNSFFGVWYIHWFFVLQFLDVSVFFDSVLMRFLLIRPIT